MALGCSRKCLNWQREGQRSADQPNSTKSQRAARCSTNPGTSLSGACSKPDATLTDVLIMSKRAMDSVPSIDTTALCLSALSPANSPHPNACFQNSPKRLQHRDHRQPGRPMPAMEVFHSTPIQASGRTVLFGITLSLPEHYCTLIAYNPVIARIADSISVAVEERTPAFAG